MDLSIIISALSGGLGIWIVNLLSNIYKVKKEYKRDTIDAWKEIADREGGWREKLETRIEILEKSVLEKDTIINDLRFTIYTYERLLKRNNIEIPEI